MGWIATLLWKVRAESIYLKWIILHFFFYFFFFDIFLVFLFFNFVKFFRFRLDTSIEHLIGPSKIPPIARPVELTSIPDSIASFHEMCLAFRYCLHCCTLLSNQDTIIKNSYCLTASLIQYLFTHVVPLRKRKKKIFL